MDCPPPLFIIVVTWGIICLSHMPPPEQAHNFGVESLKKRVEDD
nr:MAG TPA: hypothetical protein [Caudoviricetes sp.]DAL85129.1 MAG TPA: hypothetical protein [Bacteriophage sp.]